MQSITSAQTSRNQIPALHRTLIREGLLHVNLDLGGGAYDRVQQAYPHITNVVWDPYNRSPEHNARALDGIYDSVTISNVLNVIDCDESIVELLRLAQGFVAPVYISVYEGDKSGIGRPTAHGYQRNARLAAYLPLVHRVFPNARRRGSTIYA